MGFADAARAERLLRTDLAALRLPGGDHDRHEPDGAGDRADPVLAALAAAPDPDLALTGLARVFGAAEDRPALYEALRDEPDFRDRPPPCSASALAWRTT
jgi:hypothetical protein